MPWPAYWTHALPELEPLESMKIALSLPGVVGRHGVVEVITPRNPQYTFSTRGVNE
jgi:hypothetical protein